MTGFRESFGFILDYTAAISVKRTQIFLLFIFPFWFFSSFMLYRTFNLYVLSVIENSYVIEWLNDVKKKYWPALRRHNEKNISRVAKSYLLRHWKGYRIFRVKKKITINAKHVISSWFFHIVLFKYHTVALIQGYSRGFTPQCLFICAVAINSKFDSIFVFYFLCISLNWW